MVVMLALALFAQVQHRPDYNNGQLAVRYVRDEPYGGSPRYGNDTTPYLITQTFEPYKGPPTFDPGDTPPLTFTLERPGKGGWKFTDKSDSQTMEVVADENVAIPFQRWDYRGFTALNAKTGAKLWTRKPKGKGDRACIAMIRGTLYQWDAGNLTATNPKNGDILWSHPIEAKSKDVEIPPMVVKNGKLFISLEVHEKAVLYCIDIRSGQEIWNRSIGPDLSAFAVTGQRVVGYEYVTSRNDDRRVSMYCLDANNGAKVWSIPVDIQATLYAPEATDEVVFMPGCRSQSYLYRLSDGGLIKTYEMRVAKKLFGPYVLEVDDTAGLLVDLATSGERVGRIQLSKDEFWDFHSVGDRLLISYMSERPSSYTVYEIIASK